jgi:hypothetical protein
MIMHLRNSQSKKRHSSIVLNYRFISFIIIRNFQDFQPFLKIHPIRQPNTLPRNNNSPTQTSYLHPLTPAPPIRHPRQIAPFIRRPLHLLGSLDDRVRHRRLAAGVITRVRRFDHLREVPRPLVEEQRGDEVAAAAGVEPFDADFLWRGG